MRRRDDGTIELQTAICDGGQDFFIHAENVRRQPTGIHAKISIGLDAAVLGYSVFNVDRDEDRRRLANSVHKRFPPAVQKGISADEVKRHLDGFCLHLWDVALDAVASELMPGDDRIEPPDFLIEPYILADAGTLLFGPPERAKSWTGLTMAVSLDAGIQIDLWDIPHAVPVLYVNLERSKKSMARRLAMVNGALGLDFVRPILFRNARGRALGDVIQGMYADVEKHGIGCVILDSISRAGYGDLNTNDTANAIIDALNALGVAWVGIGHTPRSDESHIYGSQMFDAGADIAIHVLGERQDNVLGVGLEMTKANDLPRYPTRALSYHFDGDLGLVNICRADVRDFPEMVEAESKSIAELIRDYLQTNGPTDCTTIAEDLRKERANIVRVVRGHAWFSPGPKNGRKQLYALTETRLDDGSVS